MSQDVHSTFALKKVSLRDGHTEYALLQAMPEENGFMNDGYGIAWEAFPGWLRSQVDMARGIGLPDGYVPQISYWFYADGVPVGRAKLRVRLTDQLMKTGGHIGYGIAAAYRGKGYGTQTLRLVLRKARAFGIERALVTIDEGNIASRRVAEHCGGVLQDVLAGRCRYWVPTDRAELAW